MNRVVDKRGVLTAMTAAKLDLGCGFRKRGPDYIGIDVIDHEDVDVVGDVFDVLALIPDSSVACVFSSHFMEHIEDIAKLIQELGRVISDGGSLETVVPHFSNPYYWSDPTHKSTFGLYTMAYFSDHAPFKRAVPTYEPEVFFDLDEVFLRFKSPRPFYVRFAVRKAIEAAVNVSRATREFYEENMCYLLPCYEIECTMTRLPRRGRRIPSE
jgi:ubiquinone/menaquinone biosynthesis C-methylase UbiE